MPRGRTYAPLRVLLNNRPVGLLNKAATGRLKRPCRKVSRPLFMNRSAKR